MSGFPPWSGFNFTKTLHNKACAALDPTRQSLQAPFVVCVMGASRGIGAATAKAFDQAGATGLILTARTADALERTQQECKAAASRSEIKISLIATDVGNEASARRLAEVITTEHGRLDVLVNNAGVVSTDASAFGKLDSIGVEQIQDISQVNYVGKFLTVKHLMPILLASADGAKAIVNIASFSMHFAAEGAVGFNISALATTRLTENIAETYVEAGVMAFAVHPGMVFTSPPPGMPEMWMQAMDDDVGLCGAFLVWLTKEKREWLSGRYISANWDVEELESMKEEIVKGDKLKLRMVV